MIYDDLVLCGTMREPRLETHVNVSGRELQHPAAAVVMVTAGNEQCSSSSFILLSLRLSHDFSLIQLLAQETDV